MLPHSKHGYQAMVGIITPLNSMKSVKRIESLFFHETIHLIVYKFFNDL